uniref:Uncharacterized protein n=1 Tax=Anopheles atroparvus TaxID=41427 RepID=A0AAG5CUS5_ANOAO
MKKGRRLLGGFVGTHGDTARRMRVSWRPDASLCPLRLGLQEKKSRPPTTPLRCDPQAKGHAKVGNCAAKRKLSPSTPPGPGGRPVPVATLADSQRDPAFRERKTDTTVPQVSFQFIPAKRERIAERE